MHLTRGKNEKFNILCKTILYILFPKILILSPLISFFSSIRRKIPPLRTKYLPSGGKICFKENIHPECEDDPC